MGDVTFQLGLPLSLGRDSRLDFGLQVADILAARRISYGFSAHIHA
jgi:tetrahydromethanopterin S-methyltransferase subunit F